MTQQTFSKFELVSLGSFPGPTRDLFKVALDDDKQYTLAEANAAVAQFKEDLF